MNEEPRTPSPPDAPRDLRARLRLLVTLLRRSDVDTTTAEGRSLQRYRRIALTTASALGVRVLGMVSGLVVVPVLVRHLGTEGFGLFSSVTAVVAWATLFDFGLSAGLLNCLARANGKDDREDARRLVATAFIALLAVSVVSALALAVAGQFTDWRAVLGIPSSVPASTVTAAVIASLGAFIAMMPLSITPQIYAAYQQTYLSSWFTFGASAIGLGSVLTAVALGAGIPALAVATAIGPAVGTTASLLYALWRHYPWLSLKLRHFSRSALRSLTARSVPLFLFQVGALAVNQTQLVVLTHRCGLRTVGEFSVAMRLYMVLSSVIVLGTSAFSPSFREAHERGDRAWLRRAFRRFWALRVGLALAASLVMALAGDALLAHWLRRGDIALGRPTWSLMALMMVVVNHVTAYSDLLAVMDRLWVLVALVCGNAVLTVGLTYWLSPTLGVAGAIVGLVAWTLIVNSWVLPKMAGAYLEES